MSIDLKQLMGEITRAQHDVNPRPEWVAATRSRVLRHIEQTTAEPTTRIFTLNHLWSALTLVVPQKTVYAYVRPFVIFAICFGLGGAGWITTVSASLNSLPGDNLYPVKLAAEHAQVAVVEAFGGRAAGAEARLVLVSRRAEEITKTAEVTSGDLTTKQQRVQVAVNNLKNEVKEVSSALGDAKQSAPQAAAAVAQAVDRKAAEIKQSLETVDMHISSNDTAIALDELKQVAKQVKEDVAKSEQVTATSSAPIAVHQPPQQPTQPTAATNTNYGVANNQTVTTTPAINVRVINHPGTSVETAKPESEPPLTLSPDVVNTSTPIRLEMW